MTQIPKVDAEFVRSLMKVYNLTQLEFSNKIGITQPTLNRILNGKRGAGAKFINGILTQFPNVSYSQLIGEDKKRKRKKVT